MSATQGASVASPGQAGRALTTRTLDFWLLGGASLMLWLFYVCFEAIELEPTRLLFAQLTAAGLSLQLVVNYPHFMASYRLAYSRGWGFLRENWFQLVAVPLLLGVGLVYAWARYDVPDAMGELLRQAGQGMNRVGMATIFGYSGQGGREVLGLMALLMVVSVGWHYSKQVFGCMMVYAHFDEYPLEAWQRRGIRWGLHTIWASFFLSRDVPRANVGTHGVPIPTLGLPEVLDTLALVLWLGACAWFYVRVVRYNIRVHGKRPSANFLVPAIAFSVWWIPWLTNLTYQLAFVPLFHSLQYLPFVYKVERGQYLEAPRRSPELHSALVAGGLVLVGFAVFVLIPGALDQALAAQEAVGGAFFLFGFLVFVNVHHYFVDSVIWKFRAPEIRTYLLS